MWADINGERKKVACGPCIRGHRSSKCDHRDRVLVEVRKPGRPLSSCPHPSGSCSCERVVINYTIPKTSECACPSERTQAASAAGSSNRVQKTRGRKSTNSLTPASLEKAIKASQDAETDSSSMITRTPTNPSFAPSEKSTSNGASPPSSASSTPRIQPSPSRKQSQASDIQLPDVPVARPMTSGSREVSSCCKPKINRVDSEPLLPPQAGSCCSGKPKEQPPPAPAKKSCCSGSNQSPQLDVLAQMNGQAVPQSYGPFPPFQHQQAFQNPPFDAANQNLNYSMPGNMGLALPFGFNTPIYNHMAPGFQQQSTLPMTPTHSGPNHAGSSHTEHNCHCGDGCSCFGCAAHPNNATMTEYIRVMHHYMSTGGFGSMPAPTYDLPAYPHHPGFGAESTRNASFNTSTSNYPFVASRMAFHGNVAPAMGTPVGGFNAAGQWQQPSTPAPVHTPTPVEPQYFSAAGSMADTPLEVKTEDSIQSPIMADSPSENKDEDTPTLSPSSYFWSEMVIPGCNDATGTCQCGDGCECVGCLTHGGHNGVPLDPPTAAEEKAFNEFMAGADLGGGGANLLTGAFSEAPS